MISGDKNIFTHGSEARARFELQRAQVEQLDAFVWPQSRRSGRLPDRFASGIHSFFEIMRAAQGNRYDVITAQDPFWRGLLAWRIARRT